MFEVRCFTNIESLVAISSQWEQLLCQSTNNSYSLSWSWISQWIETFLDKEDQLLCLAVYNEKKLVGIAPFWIENKRQFLFKQIRILRFLGSKEVCADHLDLIIHKRNSERICAEIWKHLFNQLKKNWDVWEYTSVPVNSAILQSLRKFSDSDNQSLGFRINDYSACPYLDLPDKWETYLTSLSSNQRRALKISTKAISDSGIISLKFCNTVQELPQFMDTHIKLHRNSWLLRGKSGSFRTERFRKFHLKYAEEQLINRSLFLCNLELDNIPIGSFYGFVYKNTLLYYLIGVNRSAVPTANIGRVLLGYCIEEAIRRGYTGFDFLRGSESYKYDWTNMEQRELSVTFYNRSFGALVFILKQFMSSFCRQCWYILFERKVRYFTRLSHLIRKKC